MLIQWLTDEHMVDGMPLALIAIGTLSPAVGTLSSLRDVDQTTAAQLSQRRTVGIVVEVACYNNVRALQRVNSVQYDIHDLTPMGPCLQFTAIAAGSMQDEEMECIGSRCLSFYI